MHLTSGPERSLPFQVGFQLLLVPAELLTTDLLQRVPRIRDVAHVVRVFLFDIVGCWSSQIKPMGVMAV
jgi:hypothetical protein